MKKTLHRNAHMTKKISCTDKIVNSAEICICVFVHSADLWFLHLEKYLRCRFAHFVHDTFLHICTFAHLHICTFAESFANMRKCFFSLHSCRNYFANMLTSKIMFAHKFSQIFTVFVKIVKISKKSKFPKMSDSVPSVFDVFPKMSEKSSRVPEWYTSGSWANAFDNTGWQKSPEYALIRIAAGAPDLAKSPNPPPGRPRAPPEKSPLFPPDGKAPGFGARARFCSPGWNPFRSCFSWSAHNSSESSNGFRGASSSATESDTFCKCAHTSQNTRWKPPSGPTTFCTLCTPCTTETDTRAQTVHTRNTDVHTCAHLATTLDTLAENTSSMCCSCWGRRRADASFCIEHFYSRWLCLLLILCYFGFDVCYSRYATAKSRTTKGGQDEEITQGSEWGTLWDSTKCLRLCADVFPQTEKGRKKEPKKPPLFCIYIAWKGLFLGWF